jgi:hypothetical protein
VRYKSTALKNSVIQFFTRNGGSSPIYFKKYTRAELKKEKGRKGAEGAKGESPSANNQIMNTVKDATSRRRKAKRVAASQDQRPTPRITDNEHPGLFLITTVPVILNTRSTFD